MGDDEAAGRCLWAHQAATPKAFRFGKSDFNRWNPDVEERSRLIGRPTTYPSGYAGAF